MNSVKWLSAIFVTIVIFPLAGCIPGAIDSSGQWGYVIDNNYELVVYQINATTGVPTVVQKYPAGSAVQPYTGASNQEIAVDPAGRFLYVYFTGGSAETVLEYSINQATHALTLLGPAVTWSGTQPNVSSLTVDALGRFLFVSDSSGGIYSYSINPETGVLTANAAGAEFATGGSGAIGTAADPGGRFLYALLPSNAGVATMAIEGNGSLTQVGSPYVIAGGAGLSWIAVDRSGSYVAVTGSTSIYTASVNLQTGVLAPLGTVTGLNAPTMPVFDPSNQYLYIGNNNGSQIETLTFSAGTGALTAGPSVAANTNSSNFGDSQLVIGGILQ